MKKIIPAVISLLFSGNVFCQSTPCKEVIAYYCDWLADALPPNKVEYSKYTIINFAFFQPQSDGSITEGDPDADASLLTGSNSIITLAHQKGVKVMVSIGGWTWSDLFPSIAADAQKRKKFASECARHLKNYKFDGIDIDWEYPGYDEHGGSAIDKANFTLLMQDIRTAIGNTALLSSCFGSAESRMANIEWDKILPLIDMINLMTYDFFGEWDVTANHNSPLYAPAQGEPSFNVNSAFKTLTGKYNVPASKVNIGAAFYGHALLGADQLFGAITGADTQTFPNDDGGLPTYKSILAKKSLYTEHWDDNAKVPYLTKSGSPKSFVSYDDERSITLKGQYVVNNGGRGVIIWEISGDYLGAGNTPLATALIKGLCSPAATNEIKKQQDLVFYPNPTRGDVLFTITNGDGKNNVTVFNAVGQQVATYRFTQDEFHINFKNFENGFYFVTIANNNGIITKKVVKE